MKITVNNEIKKIQENSLFSLVNSVLGNKTEGVAIAINQTVISKSDWDKFLLKDGDSVLIIKATQGG